MLIFDKFVTARRAKPFAADVAKQFQREAVVCDSQDESDKHDPFPFVLSPPIVLVQRDYDTYANEPEIRRLAAKHGGCFAGT